MFLKLRTVVYHVPDLEKAKNWYIGITGIEPYFDEPFYVGFDINGYELGLDPDMTGITTGNMSTAYWAVNAIEEKLEQLRAAGATITHPLSEVGGGIKTATVNDPWGNAIGLIEGA
jgi:predicted enzyme related to lactoylglutathione lyase